jgi:integrase
VGFHDLRQTFASTLLSNGVSIDAVAGWLGHASPTITLATYAHMMPVDEDRARGVISARSEVACHQRVTTLPGSECLPRSVPISRV